MAQSDGDDYDDTDGAAAHARMVRVIRHIIERQRERLKGETDG